MRARQVFLLLHRYVGLALAAFLILLGVTGTIIAFKEELDIWINPELLRAEPPADGRPALDPFTLRDRIQAKFPGQPIDSVDFAREPGTTASFWIDEKDTFVDPYTAEIRGQRSWGKISEGKKNLIPFIYSLHASLALDDIGHLLVGIVGVLWTIDCFVGAYLTFPVPARPGTRRSPLAWLGRWAPAWGLKTAKLFSLVFSWHRASGLWFWLMFLVFAWSGVGLNLHDEIYEPVMSLAVEAPASVWETIPELEKPKLVPRLDHRAAYEVAKAWMRLEAERHDFEVLSERWLSYDPERGVYSYWVESTLDVSKNLGETHVIFDGDSGEFRGFSARAGIHAADTIFTWLIALHFGQVRIGGLPFRIFVGVLGVVTVILSVTGVWIWWRKARLRRQKDAVARASLSARERR